MQVYNEKEQAEQGKVESDSLRRKEALGSIIEQSPVLKEIKRLKRNLILNGIQGVVTSEQDHTQLSFQFLKRN